MARIYEKDPSARLDYGWDWVDWLAEVGDTIASRTVTVTKGDVVVESSAIVGTQVVAWVTGGTLGTEAEVTFHITTAGGRQDDRTTKLVIVNT